MKTEVCISSRCQNRHECPHHYLNVRGLELICPDGEHGCERYAQGLGSAGEDIAENVLKGLPLRVI